MTFHDRYEAAGLTHNPFAAWQVGDPSLLTFVDRGLPAPPPAGSRTLVQVIGESGYGKSTQLQHWRSQTPAPYHYIVRAPYRARWLTPPKPELNDILYGDEIDRMPTLIRKRWFRTCANANATLIIGTHVDLTDLAERVGFTVITHTLQPADPALLRRIIDARLEGASMSSGHLRFGDEDIDTIVTESGGVPGDADVICHRLLAERVQSLVS